MTKQLICLDLDNVLAETDTVMRRVITEYTGGRVNFNYEDISRFNYHECKDEFGGAISKDEWHDIHEIFSRFQNIMAVVPYQGIQDRLRSLKSHFDVHIATSRLPSARSATIAWLEKHDFPSTDLHFLGHGKKHLALGHCLASVEDDPDQAAAFGEVGTRSFLYAHPWNVANSGEVLRVEGWTELMPKLLAMV